MAIDQVRRSCVVVLHDSSVSKDDVLCGTGVLPTGILAGLSSAGSKILYFLAVSSARNADEVSVHVSLAQRFGFENRAKAMIEVIEDAKAVTATHVEFFFRDQHLSRADMWRIMQRLDDTVAFRGQIVHYLGSAAAEVKAVYVSGEDVESAYIARATTKPIFRSASAQYTILIQISKEMLEYWVDGDLMYERIVAGYLPELFRRWDALKARHQVSVVLFGRSYAVMGADSAGHCKDVDFFHVVLSDVASSNWGYILRKLKQAFNSTLVPRQVSLAATGNMTEALHIAAMDFANDNIDPHLSSTGRSIIAISAGAGLFQTRHSMLKSLTHLLMGNSIGVDIVALSPKPLHPVPLFKYTREGKWEYALPHWVDISFWHGADSGYKSSWLLPEVVPELNDVVLPLMGEQQQSSTSAAKMTEYDDAVFVEDITLAPERSVKVTEAGSSAESRKTVKERPIAVHTGTLGAQVLEPPLELTKTTSRPSSVVPPVKRPKRDGPPSHSLLATGRKISLGPKGLAPGRGSASTTVTTEHAQHDREVALGSPFSPNEDSSEIAKQLRLSLARKPSQQSLISPPSLHSVETTTPINIRSVDSVDGAEAFDANLVERQVLATVSESELAESAGLSDTPKAKLDPFYNAMKAAEREGHWTSSPWVTLLNPSNPKRETMRVAAQYRKWQHVFPRAVSSAAFKWASMCSPAALPLTTEYKPSMRDLEQHFEKKLHRILVYAGSETAHKSASRVLEQLILLRLRQGFQIPFTEERETSYGQTKGGERIIMSLANQHHELQCLSDAEIQVVEYSHEDDAMDKGDSDSEKYSARVRSTSGHMTRTVDIALTGRKSMPDWSRLDDKVVAEELSSIEGSGLRLRFVLIPVEPPRAGHATPGPARGLSDEERRIDGIQRLTQLWQRNRYLTTEDQRHHASLLRAKGTPTTTARDPNPLAIEYQTRDPSLVVNAYGPKLTGQLNGTESVAPLFAEAEMYHSSTFDVAKLVKQMQEPPPQGVEVRDRRWFARMHFKCFRGDEMVNWLLRVFKDVDTRDEGISIGNELMNRGIFSHVRHKHDFRDGNYFYQIASAHRTTDYPDNASMFMKGSLRSVPATPMAEARSSPVMRPIQDDASSSGRPTPTLIPTDKRQVLLSQQMLYNVDPSKKSDRPEIVSLHYDRIHNPENCYHIQLEWINASSILIRDAVSRWAGLVESHGLKLVQVPLAEASRLRMQHAFDQPIPVRLEWKPPEKILSTPVLDAANPFGQRLSEDSLAIQKSLLRKLDFVLDFEAAASFTTKLDVRYSYGEPDYDMTQFVHKSGLLLAQVSGDEHHDFLLLPNRLAAQRPFSSTKVIDTEPVEDIVRRFVMFCRDEKALKLFYEQANKPRLSAGSPFTSDGVDLDSDIPPIQLPPHLTHRAAMKNVH